MKELKKEEKNKKNYNLLTQDYVKTLIAKTNNGDFYELEEINIYTENGVVFSCRFFEPEGYGVNMENEEIENGIVRKLKIDFKSKYNFVIKGNTTNYENVSKYVLYIYYKNINANFLGFNLGHYWLESSFAIFNGKYVVSQVLGQRAKKSDKIKYSSEFEEAKNYFKNRYYDIILNNDEFKKALKTVKKYQSLYKKQIEIEANYTIEKNINDVLYDNEECQNIYKNIKKM